MPNIFNYSDYRKFLADFYKDKKASTPSFSYQNFSRQAGFMSPPPSCRRSLHVNSAARGS